MPVYALGHLVPDIDPGAYVHPDAVIIGQVSIGADSTVWPGAVLRGDFGAITVGERSSVQDGTVIHTTEEWPTVIGDEVVIGHRAHLEGCVISDRCLIGSGSIVLNRALIETCSVVGAQALVTEDTRVPTGTLALGTPARPREAELERLLGWIDFAVKEYVENGRNYARAMRRLDLPDPRAQ